MIRIILGLAMVGIIAVPAYADHCDGSIKGRWRIFVNNGQIVCTLQVSPINGSLKVVPQTLKVTRCEGDVTSGSTNIIGGWVVKNDPYPNILTGSNQCFWTGKMKLLDNPNILFTEVWVSIGDKILKGKGEYRGNFVVIDGIKY